jgi:hypothetical protein
MEEDKKTSREGENKRDRKWVILTLHFCRRNPRDTVSGRREREVQLRVFSFRFNDKLRRKLSKAEKEEKNKKLVTL